MIRDSDGHWAIDGRGWHWPVQFIDAKVDFSWFFAQVAITALLAHIAGLGVCTFFKKPEECREHPI